MVNVHLNHNMEWEGTTEGTGSPVQDRNKAWTHRRRLPDLKKRRETLEGQESAISCLTWDIVTYHSHLCGHP